jgi:hypothetical protein
VIVLENSGALQAHLSKGRIDPVYICVLSIDGSDGVVDSLTKVSDKIGI